MTEVTLETKPRSLLQRINAVRERIGYVQKTATIDNKYKAVTHDAVIAQIRQFLIDDGILILQTLVKSVSNPYEVMADMTRAKQFRYEATYSIRFVNVDDADDNFELLVESHAMDNADKAPGKAMSYAKKYAILKTFDLETGENEESRYQTTGVDVATLLTDINSADTLEELQSKFAEARAECKNSGDAEAYAAVIKATNEMKKKLGGAK